MYKFFWQRVFKVITEITGLKLTGSPEVALLSIYNGVGGLQTMKDLLTNLLTAARIMISRKWKGQEECKMEEWYKEVWDIAINDKLPYFSLYKTHLTTRRT